jgi:hypothetical protein
MHIVVAWTFKSHITADQQKILNSDMRSTFSGYSWVRPLRGVTLYLVQLETVQDRQEISKGLIGFCKLHSNAMQLIVSPVIDDGTYNGWLPKDMWEKVKARTGRPS